MPTTFDKILGKPLLHNHTLSDITDFISNESTASSVSSDQVLSSDSGNFILADASGSNITTLNITLPQASTVTNKIFKIKKIDSSAKTVNIIPHSGDQIDSLSENLIIEFQNSAAQLIAYGNGWFII